MIAHFQQEVALLPARGYEFYLRVFNSTSLEWAHFAGYQIFVTGKILVFHRCLYNRSEYSIWLRNDPKIDSIENLRVEINDLIVGVIFKPPSVSNSEFLDKLQTWHLSIIFFFAKNALLWVTPISTLKNNNISKEYLNLVQSEGFD